MSKDNHEFNVTSGTLNNLANDAYKAIMQAVHTAYRLEEIL